MAFLDKMKKGLTEAGSKAKEMVDVGRLSLQIDHKRKELEQLYAKIGEKTFQCVQANDMVNLEADVEGFCREIIQKRHEISELEQNISDIKNKKTCSCGQSVPIEAKFCPFCGNKFDA